MMMSKIEYEYEIMSLMTFKLLVYFNTYTDLQNLSFDVAQLER